MKKVLKILLVILLVLVILLIINSIRNYKILKRVFTAEENFLFNNQNLYFEIEGNFINGEQKYTNIKINYKDGILNRISIWTNKEDSNFYYNILWQNELENIAYKSFFSSDDDAKDREYVEDTLDDLEDIKLQLLKLKLSSLGNIKLYMKTNLLNFIKTEDNCYIISYINKKYYYVNKDTGLIEKSISEDKDIGESAITYIYSENTVTDEDIELIDLNEFPINGN